MGAVYYLLGCFQGSVEALRRMQELTHFNDFVIAHSHLTIFRRHGAPGWLADCIISGRKSPADNCGVRGWPAGISG